MGKEDELLAKLADSFEEVADPADDSQNTPDGNGSSLPGQGRPPSAATRTRAEQVVLRTVPVTMGVSLVPLPLVDLAAITGLQVHMTRRIAEVYDQPFSAARGKSIITALLFTALGLPAAGWVGYGLSRLVPGLGYLLGSVIMPTVVGSTTYGIGMFFVDHFQSGKGVEDIDIDEASKHVAEHAAAHRKD